MEYEVSTLVGVAGVRRCPKPGHVGKLTTGGVVDEGGSASVFVFQAADHGFPCAVCDGDHGRRKQRVVNFLGTGLGCRFGLRRRRRGESGGQEKDDCSDRSSTVNSLERFILGTELNIVAPQRALSLGGARAILLFATV